MKKKIFAALLAAALFCLTGTGNKALAWSWGYERLSPSLTTGETSTASSTVMHWSTSSYNHITGNEVAVDFFIGTRGTQDGFVLSTTREIYAMLYETDSNSEIMARKYRANFLVDSNNWYRPGSWSCINIHNTAIENDGSAELRLDLLVNAVLGDNTDVVRSNIFSYEYGIVDD